MAMIYIQKKLLPNGLRIEFTSSSISSDAKQDLHPSTEVDDLPNNNNIHDEPDDRQHRGNPTRSSSTIKEISVATWGWTLNPDAQQTRPPNNGLHGSIRFVEWRRGNVKKTMHDTLMIFAGARLTQTNFEQHFELQREAGDAPWIPFESEDELKTCKVVEVIIWY